MRTGPQLGQISFTFEIAIGLSCSAMPPLMFFCGLGRTFFLTIITCSTSTRPFSGNTRNTRPSFPRSRPEMTFTWSLRRMSYAFCIMVETLLSYSKNFRLKNFRRDRNDLQKLLLAQLAGHLTKHPGTHLLPGLV